MVEFKHRVGYVLTMDTVKALKKSEPVLSTMKTEKGLLNRRKTNGVYNVSLAFRSLSRSGMHRLARFIRRGSWLSFQYFELGSLINLYLKVLEAKDSKSRTVRFDLFVQTALRVLHGYKMSIYRRFKRTISTRRKTTLSPSSLRESVSIVYEELKTVSRMYENRRRWKQVFDTAVTLIRETHGRRVLQ
jgi:hypothetical protein